jgi:hypothetical protein
MRADGHAPGRPTPDGQDTRELLRRCARDVVDVAEGIRAVSERTSTALFAPPLTASARRRPRTGLAAQWALLRALTNKRGLGGSAITAPRGMGQVLGAAGRAWPHWLPSPPCGSGSPPSSSTTPSSSAIPACAG